MKPVTIALIYSSTHGHTRAVAAHIASGAGTAGANVLQFEVTAAQIDNEGRWHDPAVMAHLLEADAIVFGSPTYMGSLSGLMKLFLERAFEPWWVQGWKDKIAAGFTNSASRSGDKLATLSQFSVFAAQMGMIWVGVGDPPGGNRPDSTPDDVNHLGSWLGLMTQSPAGISAEEAPSAGDRHTAERFGRRIARVTQRWQAAAADFPPLPLREDEGARRDRRGLKAWQDHKD